MYNFFLSSRKINILMESGTNHLGQDCLSAVSDVASNLLSQWSYGYHLLRDSVDVCSKLCLESVLELGTN